MDVPTSQVRLLSEAFKTTPDFIAADVAAIYAAAGPTLPASSIAASASNASSAASVSHTHTQRIDSPKSSISKQAVKMTWNGF